MLHVMWRGDVGGAERAVYQLALHQHRSKQRRVALGYGQAEGHWCDLARDTGIPVIDFGMANGADVAAGLRSVKVMRTARVHHFHSLEVLLMLVSAAVPGSSRIYTHRGGWMAHTGLQRVRYLSAGPLLRRRFTITGNTAHAGASARRLWGISPDRPVPVTYNGMDLSLLRAGITPQEVRRSMGAGDATVVIGTAANLRDWKRTEWLIDAVSDLPDGDWTVWILGDGPHRAQLEERARRSPATRRIHFIGRRDDMGAWLRGMDVFVLPSGPLESFGNAAVEAMACGLPVIVAADSPGLVEHVSHGQTGFVIHDVRELSTLLADLVADGSRRASVGAAAAEFVESTYTMDNALRRYEEIYSSVTGGRRR